MKLSARWYLRIAVLVIALAIFAWRWWSAARPESASAVTPTPTASASGSARRAEPARPAPRATIRMGRLTLTACQLRQPASAVTTPAFCAKLPVPEDPANPASRTINLALAIVKSESQVPDPDLVAYLAGGPGQSAIETYPELAPAFAPLLKRHDVLLLDQRGTGDSHPLRCPVIEQEMKRAESAAPSLAQRVAWIADCAREVGKTSDPRYYGTGAAIADLEAVRQALGAPQLDLVGVSYGTRVAQHYAAAHPDAVRGIVLDGVVPNQLVLGQTFAATLDDSLKLQAAACRKAPACNQAFGDWYATLYHLYGRLQADPVPDVTFTDPATFQSVTQPMTADTLAGVVRLFSYSGATQALLPLAVNAAAHGDYAPLMGQSKILSGDLSSSIEDGMQLSVMCTEDAPLLKVDSDEGGMLLGSLVQDFIAECKAWPHGPMPKDFHAPFRSAVPTLLISGERDPVTPPAFAEEVLRGLANGRALVVKGMGHAEPMLAGCVPRLVDRFIDRLQPKKLDAACVERLGPTPAFVNFNGAVP